MRQLRDKIAKFLKLPMSRPIESGPSTKAEVRMAWIDLKSEMPSYGSPVKSGGTPNAFITKTNS